MNILLDTHILIWAASGSNTDRFEKYFTDENTLYFSPISIWEIAIKQNKKLANFNIDPTLMYNGLLANGYKELYLTSEHSLTVETLPDIHKDPFDRMLLAQAICEKMDLLTADSVLAKYSGPIIIV